VNKYVLSFLFLLASVSVFGQKKSKVDLVNSTQTEANMTGGKRIIKVRNGTFKQDLSILTSDSALFYPDLNMVDAFGHVVINQGDTLHIFSDKLNYNGNTKVAILTDNVKMVDKDATLTTNYFTYNTATRIGIYTGGGKLVNKENTLVSKNGYYFALTRDAYFRYNVVCNTTDAVIKTDTLRYNSGTRISYFYGPTNIIGAKDKDVLYTENGRYETIPERAYFGKKNLYTQGTKSLKGDSLFYDRLKGYGRAVKNVVFNDNEQKTTINGDLGEYYKAEERAVITEKPYMIFITEDSTKTDTAKKLIIPAKKNDPTAATKAQIKAAVDANLTNKKLTLQGVTDSVMKKLPPAAAQIPANKKLTLQGETDSVMKKLPANIKPNQLPNKMTLQGVTDSVMKRAPGLTSKAKAAAAKPGTVPKNIMEYNPGVKDIKEDTTKRRNVKRDTLYLSADTLETQVITFKKLKEIQLARFLYNNRDTSIKIVPPSIVYKTSPKFLSVDAPKWPVDTSYLHPYYFGKPKPPVVKTPPKKVITAPPPPVKKTAVDSIKVKQKADSLALKMPRALSDTSRIRVIYGYHNAKIFKSDLQAKADSMFYSNSDSTIRCYVNPLIWTQGSQLSGDTINLQMKNRKLDNIDLYPAGFIVNIEKTDSLHFNQVGGKKIHGTFKNSKLNTMLITGNAESIYFNRDTVKHVVTEMGRSVSSSINIIFKNGEVSLGGLYGDVETRVIPIGKVKDDEKILKGFIWKPKERPASKEAILSAKKKAPPAKASTKPASGKKPTGAAIPKSSDKKPGTDTVSKPPVKMLKDSIAKDTTAVIKPMARDITIKRDTTVKKKN
jgi:lipopolysaccharide export system protein LptA